MLEQNISCFGVTKTMVEESCVERSESGLGFYIEKGTRTVNAPSL